MSPIETEPKISSRFGIYKPEEGSFACFSFNQERNQVVPGTNHYGDFWYGCREEFHYHAFSSKTKQFLFSHPSNKRKAVAAFIEALEDRLQVPADQRIQIRATQSSNVSMVFLSIWWTSEMLRRAFLTIALRSGWEYTGNPENFEKALYSQGYFKGTKEAVQAFLKGRTTFIGKTPGNWVDMFDDEFEKDCGEDTLRYLNNIQRMSFTN